MRVIIDHKLRIAQSELSDEVENLITEALTIPNIERERAIEQGLQGWRSMPEFIRLYKRDEISSHLLLPRGFLENLKWGLSNLGITYQVSDNTLFEEVSSWGSSIRLFPWQNVAKHAIIQGGGGIWKAPAGSGKTVGVLAVISDLNCPSLVLVNKKDILYQWQSRAHQFLGEDYPVGLIGDGHFEVTDYLTVATVQTLHSRFDELEELGFFDNQFSFVCLDECHHATAKTYSNILNRFTSRYRIGVSATPSKTGDFRLATAVLGPVIHETKDKDVTTLVKPTIFRVPTKFKFIYKPKEGHIPSNYGELINRLIIDGHRNTLILSAISLNHGKHQLVCSKRLEHLKLLSAALTDACCIPDPVWMLTGSETEESRKFAIRDANTRPGVLFSTLADEALDIPALEVVHLTFPQRNTGLIVQQIGRVSRSAPGKQSASVIDYCDPIGPMERQWQARRNEIYLPGKYEVKTLLSNTILGPATELWNEWINE